MNKKITFYFDNGHVAIESDDSISWIRMELKNGEVFSVGGLDGSEVLINGAKVCAVSVEDLNDQP